MTRSHLDALLTALDGRPRPQQLRQLGDVGGDAPRLVAGEQTVA